MPIFYSNFVSSQYVMITDLLLLYPPFLVLSVSWAQDIRRYNTNGKMNKFRAMNTQNLQASFSSLKL